MISLPSQYSGQLCARDPPPSNTTNEEAIKVLRTMKLNLMFLKNNYMIVVEYRYLILKPRLKSSPYLKMSIWNTKCIIVKSRVPIIKIRSFKTNVISTLKIILDFFLTICLDRYLCILKYFIWTSMLTPETIPRIKLLLHNKKNVRMQPLPVSPLFPLDIAIGILVCAHWSRRLIVVVASIRRTVTAGHIAVICTRWQNTSIIIMLFNNNLPTTNRSAAQLPKDRRAP